jgi:hypothetical protein
VMRNNEVGLDRPRVRHPLTSICPRAIQNGVSAAAKRNASP